MSADVPTDVPATRGPQTDETGAIAASTDEGAVPAVVAYTASSDQDLPTRRRERYQLIGEHGRGGLGRVVRARDGELGRVVAVKELLRRGHQAEARFVREATITARLEHPGIVPVYEAGRWPDGTPFYAMKLVAGRPLSTLITGAGSLAARLALVPHVVAIADAIGYAHARGIIHRDLKPANVIIGDYGETVVIDWGLAKDVSDGPMDADDRVGMPYRTLAEEELTATGTTLGTPAFMSPEQSLGRPCEASDIYSLGAILYNVAVGRPPFPCEPEPVPPTVPRDLAAIIARATAAELGARYTTARELADDLRRFLRREPVTARQYRRIDRLALAAARNRRLAAVAALSLVAITGLSLTGVVLIDRQRDRAVEAEEAARTAQRIAEQNVGALTLANARLLLATDPTRAVDALDRYRGDDTTDAGLIRAEAQSLGVASRRLQSHSDSVVMLAARPDGELITAGEDATLQITSPASGVAQTIAADLAPAVTPVYAAAADRVAYVNAAAHLVVRATLTAPTVPPAALLEVALPPSPPQRLSIAPGAELVAVLHQDGTITAWRPRAGAATTTVGRLPGALAVIALADRVVAIAPGRLVGYPVDGGDSIERAIDADVTAHATEPGHQRLAVGFADGRVQRWRLRDLEPEPARAACTGAVTAVSVDAPRWLAYGCRARAAGAIDLDTGTDVAVPLESAARLVSTDVDGRLLMVGTMAGLVHVRDLASGFAQELRGHQAEVVRLRAPSPELPYLVTSDDKGEVRLWDPPRWPGQLVAPARLNGASAWIADGGRRLIAAGAGGLVRLWELPSGRCRVLPGPSNLVSVLRLSPDGRRAVTAGYEGVARLWDLEAGHLLATLSAHTAAIVDVEFLDDRTVVTAGNDGQVIAWWPSDDRHRVLYRDRRALYVLEPLRAIDAVAATTSDGRVLIIGRDGAAREVPGASGQALRASLDGSALAFGDAHGQVTHYDPRRQLLSPVTRLSQGVRHIVFDGTAGQMAIAGERGELHVMSLSGPTRAIHVDDSRTRVVAFSHDGRILAAGGGDGAIRLLVPGDNRWTVTRLHTSELKSLQFSPDNRTLAAMSLDGRIVLVDVDRALSMTPVPADATAPAPFPPCAGASP